LIQQERVGRRLMPVEDVRAKFRTQPFSVYFRWNAPDAGREAIYVEGANDDHVLMHKTGIRKAFTGTVRVDPESRSARTERRHSIRESGIGQMIDKLITRWEYERRFDETVV